MRDTADKRAAAVLMQALHFQNLMVADGQSHPKAAACRDRRPRVELPPMLEAPQQNHYVTGAYT